MNKRVLGGGRHIGVKERGSVFLLYWVTGHTGIIEGNRQYEQKELKLKVKTAYCYRVAAAVLCSFDVGPSVGREYGARGKKKERW